MGQSSPYQKNSIKVASATERRLRAWAFAVICILGSAAVTVASFEFLFLSDIPPMMLGKWVVSEGEQEGAILEFFKDGTVKGMVKQDGKEGTMQWKVIMNGDKFQITAGDTLTNMTVTGDHTILELSDRYFVFQDSQGNVMKTTRVRSPGIY